MFKNHPLTQGLLEIIESSQTRTPIKVFVGICSVGCGGSVRQIEDYLMQRNISYRVDRDTKLVYAEMTPPQIYKLSEHKCVYVILPIVPAV